MTADTRHLSVEGKMWGKYELGHRNENVDWVTFHTLVKLHSKKTYTS